VPSPERAASPVTLSNALTLSRIPLAAVLWLGLSPLLMLATMALAGLTDVLDGPLARHRGEAHPIGEWLDPFCDKVFMLSALCAIARAQHVPWEIPVLIAAREILQVPFVIAHLLRPRARELPPSMCWKAAWIGKIATVAQFLAICAMLFERSPLRALAILASLLGSTAAIYYILRALRQAEPAQELAETPLRRIA
jgi:cardiolipin synthase (CMP-forming)